MIFYFYGLIFASILNLICFVQIFPKMFMRVLFFILLDILQLIKRRLLRPLTGLSQVKVLVFVQNAHPSLRIFPSWNRLVSPSLLVLDRWKSTPLRLSLILKLIAKVKLCTHISQYRPLFLSLKCWLFKGLTGFTGITNIIQSLFL